jgi:hypothetical protein
LTDDDQPPDWNQIAVWIALIQLLLDAISHR